MSRKNLIRLIVKISVITSLIVSILVACFAAGLFHVYRQHEAKVQQEQAAAAVSAQAQAVLDQQAAAQAAAEAASAAAARQAADAATSSSSTEAQTASSEASAASAESTEESSSEASSTETAAENIDEDTGIALPDGVADTTWGKDAVMQIVAIGDSQFGNFKGEDGVAHLLSEYCHANVYNLAVGGSCAAVLPNDSVDEDNWDNTSGVGMAKLMAGRVSTQFLSGESTSYQLDVYEHCDLSKTDVFVVEYGVNDFLAKIPIDKEGGSDIASYRGALRTILSTIRDAFPDAVIVLCSPCYAQFFDNGTYIGDSNTLDYGYGKLIDYVNAANNLVDSDDVSNCRLMNPYYSLGINAGNARDNLIDGIHMNAEFRAKYTQLLARHIIRSQGYSIEQDTDPSTVEWWTTKSE